MISDKAVEAALEASVPGGSQVWCWLPQKDAWTPHETAKDVMRCALQAALPVLLEGKAEEIARVIIEIVGLDDDPDRALEIGTPCSRRALSAANRIISILTGESE